MLLLFVLCWFLAPQRLQLSSAASFARFLMVIDLVSQALAAPLLFVVFGVAFIRVLLIVDPCGGFGHFGTRGPQGQCWPTWEGQLLAPGVQPRCKPASSSEPPGARCASVVFVPGNQTATGNPWAEVAS